MSKSADTTVSLSPRSGTFTVGFQPASCFLGGLRKLCVANTITSPADAVLFVRNGEIHLSTPMTLSVGPYATLIVIDASTAASWTTTNSFAITVKVEKWLELISASFTNHEAESFWIYKIGASSDLYCVVGNESEPINLGEATFVEDDHFDPRKLPMHKVRIEMIPGYLTNAFETFKDLFYPVVMHVKNDRIIWRHTMGQQVIHTVENNECKIEGLVGPEEHYVPIGSKHEPFLVYASLSAFTVEIQSLDGPRWRDWTLFTFHISLEASFCYLMHGPPNCSLLQRLKGLSSGLKGLSRRSLPNYDLWS